MQHKTEFSKATDCRILRLLCWEITDDVRQTVDIGPRRSHIILRWRPGGTKVDAAFSSRWWAHAERCGYLRMVDGCPEVSDAGRAVVAEAGRI